MRNTALERFWELVGWVFALNGEAFRVAAALPKGLVLALLIVLLAELSQGLGQSVILFVNQVKPGRFAFSLALNAVLFTVGFLFLTASTWLAVLLFGGFRIPFSDLAIAFGLAYAPLLFAFFGAMPYLGEPILTGLSVWHFLATVVGFGAVAGTNLGRSFAYVAIGWGLLKVLERTVGRPIARLGCWLTDKAAGTSLAASRRNWQDRVRDRAAAAATTWQEDWRASIDTVRQNDLTLAGLGAAATGGATPDAPAVPDDRGAAPEGNRSEPRSPQTLGAGEPEAAAPRRRTRLRGWLKTLLSLVGIALVTGLAIVFLEPLRLWWFGWYDGLPRPIRWGLDLAWIGAIALAVASLLAPLETLGWWAGWYDDEVDATVNAGKLAAPLAEASTASRYAVYLDGIGKSTFEYLPDIEAFLTALAPKLPEDVALVRDIMPYSVVNNPLDEDRPLAFLWRWADRSRFANPASLLGMLVNLRNVLIVAVSADRRYGPLYNQGIAQVVYNGLVNGGYRPGSGAPVTLIGYSGGGQMSVACAPFLKRAIDAPIEVISLGGVMAANSNFLELERLYHLVGDRDEVERIGPIAFPGRWKLFPLSYWNRAKRRGIIAIESLGSVGHQVPGGILDPDFILDDGQSALDRTLGRIRHIFDEARPDLAGEPGIRGDRAIAPKTNYGTYCREAPFIDPRRYPIGAPLPGQPGERRYWPVAAWMGRPILPEPGDRRRAGGIWFEVRHAPADRRHWVGRVVALRWSDTPDGQALARATTRDVHFSADATYSSRSGQAIHPDRLNGWKQVGPLESLAGAHPRDDLLVAIAPEVVREPEVAGDAPKETRPSPDPEPDPSFVLEIGTTPLELSGLYYGLVQFLGPTAGDGFRARHFNRATRQFDGPLETLALPPVVRAPAYGSRPSTADGLARSPANETGWYVYGQPDGTGTFVVRALIPRALWRLQPDRQVTGKTASLRYLLREAWADPVAQKGRTRSVLCTGKTRISPGRALPPDGEAGSLRTAIAQWQPGDRALVLHVYGGIGGPQREPAAATPIFFGHFAYGVAEVVRDPLADELRFDLRYYQVYTHNTDGLVAGTLHGSRYLGDRQLGWLGTRPTCDVIVKLAAFDGDYPLAQAPRSPLALLERQLQAMTARYRIGDGTGGTFVGPANNCAQDSNCALFASLQDLRDRLEAAGDRRDAWERNHPEAARRLHQLEALGRDLQRELQLFGRPRPDWARNAFNLGSTLEDRPLRNLAIGLGSWRALLPRLASDTIARTFLKYGATLWVLRTNQVGGRDRAIEPIAPTSFTLR